MSLLSERKPARLRVSDWSAIVSIAGRLEGASGTLALQSVRQFRFGGRARWAVAGGVAEAFL